MPFQQKNANDIEVENQSLVLYNAGRSNTDNAIILLPGQAPVYQPVLSDRVPQEPVRVHFLDFWSSKDEA